MDKRIIAIILALIVAVPAAVCMAQYDSEAADPTYDGYDEKHAVNLGSITLDAGGSMKIDLRNNETAYAEYTYEMSFMVKNGEEYNGNLGTFKSGEDVTAADGVSVADGKITLTMARDGTNKTGEFTITAKAGENAVSTTEILIKCTVTVTAENNGTVSDEIYYKLSVTVVKDGSITFGNTSVDVVKGELVGDDASLGISAPTVSDGMTVYAYGLPAGINVVISDEDVKLTGMTSDTAKVYTVTVVLRETASGMEYRGNITVNVNEAPTIEYTAVLEDSKDGGNTIVKGTNGNYTIFYGAAENVTLKITGMAQAFGGSVFIYQQGGDSISTPVPADENSTSGEQDDKVTTYTIPVGGIGSYIIEILNVDGTVDTVTLTVLPVSTGSVGLIVVGN